MANIKPRVRIPRKAKAGEVVEIKSLIEHKMETGQRKGKDGKKIPRKIINRFECKFEGDLVFASDWHPAISANPYLAFHMRAEKNRRVRIQVDRGRRRRIREKGKDDRLLNQRKTIIRRSEKGTDSWETLQANSSSPVAWP